MLVCVCVCCNLICKQNAYDFNPAMNWSFAINNNNRQLRQLAKLAHNIVSLLICDEHESKDLQNSKIFSMKILNK